jgi:rSAM/selenodomain-associated transferase 1
VSSVEKAVDRVDNPLSPRTLPSHGAILGMFAKQPVAGRVKTRLTPPLHPRQACTLYRIALQESVTRFVGGPVPLVVCGAGRRAWFTRAFPALPLYMQGRGDLGARLARCTAALFAGGGPVAVVGSDSPDLPLDLIDAAFAALASADVAVVACRDGGYALLALRQPAPGLFADMPWSSAALLAATRRRAALLGLRFVTVGEWDDLDDLAALQRLVQRSPACKTAQYVRAYLGSLLPSGCG